ARHRPRPLPAAAVLLGLALFLAGLLRLAREGVDGRGAWRAEALRRGAALALLGFALLVAGLVGA
ncbi:MAG: hypothetical protein AAF447_21855, partial [Myxococcota bacterium]